MLALAAALLLTAPPSAAFPYPLEVTKLPNGLTVARAHVKSNGLSAFYTVVRVGSRNEVEPGKTGFAHFFEHMMFKGTKQWPGSSRADLLAKLGYSENAFTSSDVTVFHIAGPTSALDRVIEVEADRFQHLDYGEEQFRTEAKAVLGEYHANAASPGLKIAETLAATAWTTHPYRHTTLGFYDDVKAMPLGYAYSKQFFARWYTPDDTILFVVGDFDDAKLLAQVTAAYGGWKGKAAPVVIPPEPEQKAPRVAKVEWPHPTLPRLGLYWKTPASKGSDAAVQSVLAAYLAGPTSPLYKQLVLEQQKAQVLWADSADHRDPSLFGLSVRLREERFRDEVSAALEAKVEELRAGKVDAARVQQVKDHIRFATAMDHETPDEIASALAYLGGVTGAPDAFPRHLAAIDEVKPEQLVAFARRYLVPARRTTLDFTVAPAPKEAPP